MPWATGKCLEQRAEAILFRPVIAAANFKTEISPDFVCLEFNLFLEIASLVLDPSEQVLLLEFDDVIQILGQVFQFLQRDSTVFVTRNAPIDASTNASNLTQV